MIYDKICVVPHQIVDEDLDIQEVGHNGAEYYLRANKVMEILKSKKDNILLGRSMWALPEDQQTEVYCISAIIEEIETLKSE